jgi:hypothetical protein
MVPQLCQKVLSLYHILHWQADDPMLLLEDQLMIVNPTAIQSPSDAVPVTAFDERLRREERANGFA